MYKVYLENDFMILTLREVRELTEATDSEIRNIFLSRVCVVNGFEIINLCGGMK